MYFFLHLKTESRHWSNRSERQPTLSAQQTSMPSAAKVRFPPILWKNNVMQMQKTVC